MIKIETPTFCNFKGILPSAPISPDEGWTYINSVNDTLYIYYGGTWQALHLLTPAVLEYLLQENNDYILLEDGINKLALG